MLLSFHCITLSYSNLLRGFSFLSCAQFYTAKYSYNQESVGPSCYKLVSYTLS